MPSRAELLADVVRLGREFARRGMGDHARIARLYWLALRFGLTRGTKLDVSVDASWAEEWREIFALPERPRSSGCPTCPKRDALAVRTFRTLPQGHVMECTSCRARWIAR